MVRGMEAISTFALLDLLGLPKTTANGRRIAQTMRSLGFVPIKSRRLMPGGYRDTVTRGWARPVRAIPNKGDKLGRLDLKTAPARPVCSEAENVKTAGGCYDV